jgi:hypothetical protein
MYAPSDRAKILKKLQNPFFHGAFLSSEDHINYLNIENLGHFYYRRSKEVVFFYYLCIYMHKPTPLRDEIDEHILNAASFGLIQHWVSSYTKRPYIKSHYHNVSSADRSIDNSHLRGAYQIYFGGILIAVLTFLMEHLWIYLKMWKKI